MKKYLILKLCILCGIISCYALAYYFPMWSFKFIAPQYPQGLKLDVLLTGARGDVFEIDIINHYIGMSKLEYAAIQERIIAPYVLILLSFIAIFITFIKCSTRTSIILSLPIIAFPFAFVFTFYYWLYRFGHDLNPAAPVEITPFTPTIIGTGIIGQFKTFAAPNLGFYSCCLAAILIITIIKLKNKKHAINS